LIIGCLLRTGFEVLMKIAQLMLFWSLWYLAFSTRSLISPFLPILEDEFSINHASAGGLLFFTVSGGTLALALTGCLAKQIGYKRLIAWSFLLAAGALCGLCFAGSYASFAICLFFFGIGGGFYLPCAVPMITTVFDRQNWGKAIAVHETAAGFSILSIPFLVALALGIMPWRYIFLVLAGLFILLVLVFRRSGPDPAPQRKNGTSLLQLLARGDFWIILVLWVASGVGVMGVYNIVPLFLVDEKQMAVETANQMLSLSRVGGFAGQIGLGFFMDRLRTKSILAFLSIASGLSALGLAAAQSQWLLAIMLVSQGTFCVVFFPAGIVAISKLTRSEERSLYTGAIMAVSGIIGMGIAPALLGAIADIWNFQIGLYLLGLGTLAVCPLIAWLKEI
jgi:NNP family nitrate/nitrite transporter-like MFS transporter